MRPIIMLITFLLGFSNAQPDSAKTAVTKITDTEKTDDTFKVFTDPAGQEYFPKERASYYTRYLSAMKEPSVQARLPEGTELVLRLTYLPSFGAPLAVRIWKTGGVFHARTVALKRPLDQEPLKITLDKDLKLEGKSTKDIESIWGNEAFWRPWNSDENILVSGGLDGARSIFKLHDARGYRMIDVWSPEALSAVKNDKEGLKNAQVDPTKLRDFDIYITACIPLLKMAGNSDYAVFDGPLDPDNGEQVGADQPATRSESKPEGKENPQPESEGRSR